MSGIKLKDRTCPICKENTNKKVAVIPIVDSNENETGEVVEIHLDCLLESLVCNKSETMIYCITTKKPE